MKAIIKLLSFIVLIVTIFSCNDDFLEKNDRSSFTRTDTIYATNIKSTVDVSYSLMPISNKSYTITYFPKWITLSSMHGEIDAEGTTQLSFFVDTENQVISGLGIYNASIVLDVKDYGLISIPFTYLNAGNPVLQCSASELNFESLNSKIFTISNISDGFLVWQITGIPDWLTLSETSGTLYSGQSITITAYWKSGYPVPDQDISDTLHILNNSSEDDYMISVTLKASALIPSNVASIQGEVTDAEYNKGTGIMAICTKSPNSLILYNTTSNESKIMSLAKTPACVSIAEDGHTAVIGYSVASVAYINLDEEKIIEEYDIDCIPYDIVLGDNSWCYITPTIDQWVYFRSLNLKTGVVTVGKNGYTVYEKTMIKKIPNKPYLIGSRMNLSPTGILMFDVSKGIASDTIAYWHESIGNFWISQDGTKLFTAYRKVYQMPQYDSEFHTTSPNVFGEMGTSQYYISAFDDCSETKRIFTVSAMYWYSEDTSSKIEQFNSDNLNKINEFEVSPEIVNDESGITIYQTSVKYVFVDQKGINLYAIKMVNQDYNIVNWSIEKFDLN